MSNLAISSPDDDRPSQLGLQSPPDWGRFQSYRSQLTNAGLNDEDANAAAFLLEDDNVFGIETRSDSDGEFAKTIANQIGVFALDESDNLSAEYAFTKDQDGDLFSDCSNGICPLSGNDLAFLDALIDEGA